MKNKKIMIVGGTGALGKTLVEKYHRENKIIIFSAIDNLIKGAAGQAVQNMNLMYKLRETTGLK